MIILLGVGAANFCWFILGSVLFFVFFFQLGLKMLFSYRPIFSIWDVMNMLSFSILSMCDEYMTHWKFG